MKRENKENLVALIKIKKLFISNLIKEQESFMENDNVSKCCSSLIYDNKIEIKILTGIIKSEEKNNGTRW